MPYVAVHTTVLERFIACTGERGNLVYLMYLVDATSYLGYVVVLLIQKLARINCNMLQLCLVGGIAIGVLVLIAGQLCRKVAHKTG